MDTDKKPREHRKRRHSLAVVCRMRYRANMKRAEKVFKLFQRTLSLAKTAEKLGVTGERVRQILQFGHRTGVITYFGKVDTRRLAVLLAKADRAALARDLGALTPDEVCAKYGIADSLGYKLHKYAAKGRSIAGL
jgi:hypothetical protein